MFELASTLSKEINPPPIPLTEQEWKRIGEIVKTDIARHIDEQTQLTGAPYAPLKPETIARKSRPHRIDHPGQEAAPASRALTAMQRESLSRRTTSLTRVRRATGSLYVSLRPDDRLVDGGNLMRNQVIEVVPGGVDISIGPTRTEIAFIQQEQPGPGNVATVFFGIGEEASAAIDRFIDSVLDKWLDRT